MSKRGDGRRRAGCRNQPWRLRSAALAALVAVGAIGLMSAQGSSRPWLSAPPPPPSVAPSPSVGSTSSAPPTTVGSTTTTGHAPAPASTNPVLVWQRLLPGVTIRESSPVPADLGRPAVVVGAHDGKLYAFDLADGATVPGWPVQTNAAINSSPAAADTEGVGTDQVYVGAGTADSGQCSGGGVFSFEASGALRWARAGFDPNCTSAREPFHSSPTIGSTLPDGSPKVVIGALGLNDWSLSANGGDLVRGWPIYTDDTSFSTAALANVAGQASPIAIIGGDASPGGPQVDAALNMPPNWRGGLVRAVDGAGKVLWQFFTDDMVRSSPAIGDITGNGQASVVFGTGNYWLHQPGGAQDSTKVFALTTSGQPRWSRDLGGVTMSSPALADVEGNGVADVVIGTAEGPDPGKVWVLDGNGQPLPHWAGHDSGGGVVIGGITAADLNGDGAQDLLVPTGRGVFAYDGRTGATLFTLDRTVMAVQNSVLVTQDRPGVVGLTVAGTTPGGVGIVQHWVLTSATPAIGPLSWPMFHHDPRHTGNLNPPPLSSSPCESAPKAAGYWVAARDGGVFGFCDAGYQGSGVGVARASVVGMAPTADGGGYWLASADGGVFAFGDAHFAGSLARRGLRSWVVAITATPDGRGYWLLSADGGVFAFGDAPWFGSAANLGLAAPATAITSTPDGRGYWVASADGGVFAFGDARFLGAARPGPSAIVGMAAAPAGNGYWLAAADGGVFAFGDAPFEGSAGGTRLQSPVVAIERTGDGRGYWLAAADGGVFTYGDAGFLGSAAGIQANEPVVGIAARPG